MAGGVEGKKTETKRKPGTGAGQAGKKRKLYTCGKCRQPKTDSDGHPHLCGGVTAA